MTDQWNNGSGVQDPAAVSNSSSNDRWIRRPRRSTGDRKIAGVAGGLGRAFGVDPVLIRVALVVLTIFGGFGGLLYVLGWLLLPADGDEVSAAEALLGRGHSSVPPPLAVGLGVVAVISAFSMFSWGLPFLPLAIGGIIWLAIMRKRGRIGHQGRWSRGSWSSGEWPARGGSHDDWMHRTDEQVRAWSDRIEDWAGAPWAGRGPWQGRGQWQGCGSRRRDWAGSTTHNAGTSPFEQPAFWEQPSAGTRVDRPAPGTPGAPSGVNMTKPASPTTDVGPGGPTPRTTPPAWDPLGVAPFAWDLPEPTPLPAPSAPKSRGAAVVGRVALGATLLVGAVTGAGVFAGWWALTWAQVSGIALGVLGLGLLVSALRGRGWSLIGPGVFLSLVTLALAVTGVSGTSGYGARQYQPHRWVDVLPTYAWNAGDLQVDLSEISEPLTQDQTVTVDLNGGHVQVVLPANAKVAVTCTADFGQVDCLGNIADGVKAEQSYNTQNPDANKDKPDVKSSTLKVIVKVNAGFALVTDHA